MFKKTLVTIISILALSGCAQKESTQTILKQSVYNLETTYTIVAESAMPFVTGEIPGVKVSQADKELMFRASNTLYSEIQSLKESIDKNEPLSITLVNAVEVDLQSFVNCWADIRSGKDPTACEIITQGASK